MYCFKNYEKTEIKYLLDLRLRHLKSSNYGNSRTKQVKITHMISTLNIIVRSTAI